MVQALEPIVIAILAKAPEFAKTRLRPVLGDRGAAALQARLIEHTVEKAVAANIGSVTLWAAPDEMHPVFLTAAKQAGIALARQPDSDLGERMHIALASSCPALVIGTDCPVLTADHLREGAELLRNRVDIVLAPVEDGGYALIGARRPQPQLFTGMQWGTATVLADTRRRISELGLASGELETLWDVDRPEDLARLQRTGFTW
jgi:rSAM/selenodomain-associated transferase 1